MQKRPTHRATQIYKSQIILQITIQLVFAAIFDPNHSPTTMDSSKNKNTTIGQVVSHNPIGFNGKGVSRLETIGTNTNLEVTPASSRQGSYDLTSLFECPVCFDYVTPPILQCANGHLGNYFSVVNDHLPFITMFTNLIGIYHNLTKFNHNHLSFRHCQYAPLVAKSLAAVRRAE